MNAAVLHEGLKLINGRSGSGVISSLELWGIVGLVALLMLVILLVTWISERTK